MEADMVLEMTIDAEKKNDFWLDALLQMMTRL
jgi:hypothetical protein